MRYLPIVIGKLLSLIPEYALERYGDLVSALNDVRKQLAYRAPETIGPHEWTVVAELLTINLGEPDCDWKRKIADLFADKIQ